MEIPVNDPDGPPGRKQKEHRQHPRTKVTVPVELQLERASIPLRVKTANLSTGGLYVEMMFTRHARSLLRPLTFALEQAKTGIMSTTFDPHIGAATRWQKGQPSPNPGGRPHKTALTDAIRYQLAQVAEKDQAGRTNAEVIAAVLITRAKRGDVRAASEIADRAEGRPSQSLNLQGRMEVSTVEERRARIEVLIRKLIAGQEAECVPN